ncbi:unnamed protein product [Diplocarpon coronariae]
MAEGSCNHHHHDKNHHHHHHGTECTVPAQPERLPRRGRRARAGARGGTGARAERLCRGTARQLSTALCCASPGAATAVA